jgi:hypothetical protein
MGAAFLGLHAGQDHALPEIRHPASTLECIDLESSLFQRLRKRAARPEFDVAMIPQNGEVIIHLSGSSKEEILEVAMVRSRDDQPPPAARGCERYARTLSGHTDAQRPQC